MFVSGHSTVCHHHGLRRRRFTVMVCVKKHFKCVFNEYIKLQMNRTNQTRLCWPTCSSSVLTVATAPPSVMQRYWLLIQSARSWLNRKHFSPWGLQPAGHGLHSLSEQWKKKKEKYNMVEIIICTVCFNLLQAQNDLFTIKILFPLLYATVLWPFMHGLLKFKVILF